MTLKEYVIRTYDTIAELTEGRLAYLNKILDRINASKYTRQQFYEGMGLDDINFFSLLAILFDENYTEKLVEFGNQFNTVEPQKSLS